MRCASVLYLVAVIFVVVWSAPELCEISEFAGGEARCDKYQVNHTFDFIPPISQVISRIDLEGQPLKQLPYNAFRNVSSQSSVTGISLRLCEISHVDAGALLNLHNLTMIDLSYNDINHIESTLFSHTRQITNIYMGYNKIEVVPSGLFQNLLLLDSVYLSDNRIHQVERFSFKNTPSLRIIDLGNNRIEFMDILFKDKIDNLSYLWLNDNPLKCDCALRPIYEILMKFDSLNHYGLVCDKPAALHGREWRNISRDEFVCPSEDEISAEDSVTTSTDPMTRYQQGDTDIPQPAWNQNWILYTTLVLVLVCVAIAVIVGVALLKRRSFRRANACNMDSDL